MSRFTGWHLLDHAAQARLAEQARPRMVELAQGMGARGPDEVRAALELVAAACRAELDADTPTPPLSRAQRRGRR